MLSSKQCAPMKPSHTLTSNASCNTLNEDVGTNVQIATTGDKHCSEEYGEVGEYQTRECLKAVPAVGIDSLFTENKPNSLICTTSSQTSE